MESHSTVTRVRAYGLSAVVASLLLVAAPAAASAAPTATTAVHPATTAVITRPATTQWSSCQASAVTQAPGYFWSRIRQATEAHHDIPVSFWTNRTYRYDIARIVCYESSFDYHAENAAQYGWFQMNKPLIESEGVSFAQYWDGTRSEPPGWFEMTAGERYIHSCYGNPAVAWQHENVYGWY